MWGIWKFSPRTRSTDCQCTQQCLVAVLTEPQFPTKKPKQGYVRDALLLIHGPKKMPQPRLPNGQWPWVDNTLLGPASSRFCSWETFSKRGVQTVHTNGLHQLKEILWKEVLNVSGLRHIVVHWLYMMDCPKFLQNLQWRFWHSVPRNLLPELLCWSNWMEPVLMPAVITFASTIPNLDDLLLWEPVNIIHMELKPVSAVQESDQYCCIDSVLVSCLETQTSTENLIDVLRQEAKVQLSWITEQIESYVAALVDDGEVNTATAGEWGAFLHW